MAAKKPSNAPSQAPSQAPDIEVTPTVWSPDEIAQAQVYAIGTEIAEAQALGWSLAEYLGKLPDSRKAPKVVTEPVKSSEPVPDVPASEPVPDQSAEEKELAVLYTQRKEKHGELRLMGDALGGVSEGAANLFAAALVPWKQKVQEKEQEIAALDARILEVQRKLSATITAKRKAAMVSAEKKAVASVQAQKSEQDATHRARLEPVLSALKARGRIVAKEVSALEPDLLGFKDYVASDGYFRADKSAPATWHPADQAKFPAYMIEGHNLLLEGRSLVASYISLVEEGAMLIARGMPQTSQGIQEVNGWLQSAMNQAQPPALSFGERVSIYNTRLSAFLDYAEKRAGSVPVVLETIPTGGKPEMPASGPTKFVGESGLVKGHVSHMGPGGPGADLSWDPFKS